MKQTKKSSRKRRAKNGAKPVRSSAWVAEVRAARELLQDARDNLRAGRAGDALAQVSSADDHLHIALYPEPRPSATDGIQRQEPRQ